MASLGDRVKVNFHRGAVLSGTASIIGDAPLAVWGRIVDDLGHSWLVRLEVSVEGKNLIVIPKEAEITNVNS